MKPVQSIRFVAALALLATSIAGQADDHARAEAWLFAPGRVIGPRLEDWAEHFGPGYVIDEPAGHANPHTGEPMITLRIGDGDTSAVFVINLARNHHHLIAVESTSMAFLAKLGVDRIPVGDEGSVRIEDDWDFAMNDLTIEKRVDGSTRARWTYYLD